MKSRYQEYRQRKKADEDKLIQVLEARIKELEDQVFAQREEINRLKSQIYYYEIRSKT